MAKRCKVTGIGPLTGNKVSHSNRKATKRSMPNLQTKRFWLPSEGRWVTLRLSTRAIRTIDKQGIETVVARLRREGVAV
jgi:large subunit ribosomal protein L28